MNSKILLIFLLTLFGFEAKAHEYYFAFAEMEYKEQEQKIELTLIFSSHDLQTVWLRENIISKGFHGLQNTAQSIYQDMDRMEVELRKEFQISNEGKHIELKLDGFHLTENGMVEFYLSAEKVVLENEFEVHFSTLMKEFPQQQNKITYRNKANKQTAVFLQQQQTQKLTK